MQRPTSVTVFGILNIVFALWGGIGLVASSFILYSGAFETVDLLPDSSIDEGLNLFGLAAGGLGGIALLVSGIGLLQMRPWGRQLAIAYAVLTVLVVVGMTAINGIFVLRPLLAEMDAPATPEEMGARFGAIGGVIGSCAGLIYPGLLWYFMTRPPIVAAFGGAPLPADYYRVPTGPAPPPHDPNNPYGAPYADPRPMPEYSASPSAIDALIPSKNRAALWSYYLGLFSLFPCLGFFLAIPAVILGIKGLRFASQHPEVRGSTHAWVGVICGGVFGLFNLLLLAGFAIGMATAALEQR